jgi:hypothetical protein
MNENETVERAENQDNNVLGAKKLRVNLSHTGNDAAATAILERWNLQPI